MRIAALALVGAAALALAGCTPAGDPTGLPTPTATPVFASDAAALKAAEKAYAAYLAASNSIAQNGWASTDQFAELETGKALKNDLASAASYREQGLRQVGEASFDSFKLEQARRTSPATVTAYLCLDVSQVDVIDASGASIVPTGRVSRNPLEVTFVGTSSRTLKISESEAWPAQDFC